MEGFVADRPKWFAGDVFTNPSDGDVLVDTGQLAPGNYLVGIAGSTNIALVFDLQLRNAANGANVKSQRRRPTAGDIDFLVPSKVFIDKEQRLRCVLSGSVTGQVQMSIFTLSVDG